MSNVTWVIAGLRDPAYEGQKAFGIPHPAVYVINKEGKVSWAKIESNYRERPGNQELRAALDRMSADSNQGGLVCPFEINTWSCVTARSSNNTKAISCKLKHS